MGVMRAPHTHGRDVAAALGLGWAPVQARDRSGNDTVRLVRKVMVAVVRSEGAMVGRWLRLWLCPAGLPRAVARMAIDDGGSNDGQRNDPCREVVCTCRNIYGLRAGAKRRNHQ